MRDSARVHRCPYCSSPLGRKDGGPLLPGHLVICDGCAAPSAFDDAGDRLVRLDAGELTVEVREGVAAAQRVIRERYANSGGLPPGYVWRWAPVCLSCCVDSSEGEAAKRVALEEQRFEVCVLCEVVTSVGFYHRMLRPRVESVKFLRLKESIDRVRDHFVSAVRQWANQELDVGCACCGKPFYNQDGDPVCGGCRIDAPYKRDLLRKRLLETLFGRVLASLPPTVVEVRNLSLRGAEFHAGLYGSKR